MTDSEKEERYDRILDTLVDQFMQRDNSLIKSPHNKTKYKGVTQSGEKRFTARLTIKGSHSHLGTFETAEDAAYAYKKAVLKEKFFAEMIKATCKRVKELPRIPQKDEEDEEKDEGEEEVDLSKAMDGVKLMDSWAKIEADAVADDAAVQLMIDENAELKARNAELIAKLNKYEGLVLELEKENAGLKDLIDAETLRDFIEKGEEDEDEEDEDEEDKEDEDEEDEDEDEDTKYGEWSQEIKETRRAMCQRIQELLLIAKSRSGKPEDTHALWKKLMREDEEHTAYQQKLWALVAKAKARSVALQEKIELEKLAEHPMVKQLEAENAALKAKLKETEKKPESWEIDTFEGKEKPPKSEWKTYRVATQEQIQFYRVKAPDEFAAVQMLEADTRSYEAHYCKDSWGIVDVCETDDEEENEA